MILRKFFEVSIDAFCDEVARRFSLSIEQRNRFRKTYGKQSDQIKLGCSYGLDTDDCLMMWIRNRLDELGCFGFGCNPQPNDNLPVELHIGFLSIEETDEMISRLRNEPVEQGIATTSKIFSTSLVPSPIDKVAARVTFGK